MTERKSSLNQKHEHRLSSSPGSQGDETPKGSFKKMPLLDADELRFFSLLSQAIDPSQAIFTKVPLETILHPQKQSEKSFLVFKEVDYLICDANTTLPICAIDIGQIDPEVFYFLNLSGIPVVKLEGVLSSNDLRRMIATAKPVENIPFPEEIHDVEVTIVGNTKHTITKKTYPKIVLSIIQKPLRKRIIEHCLGGAVVALILSVIFLVARVIWTYYTT